jgi:hypothetical protein
MLSGLSALVNCGSSDDGANDATPTFYQDAAPIFEAKCVGCHRDGGIAPFSLHDYGPAHDRASQIADYTKDRVMPPFLVETGGECGDFDESSVLTDDQIATIGAWAAGGALEGQPVERVLPAPPQLEAATTVSTPQFLPVISGGRLAEFDEYRCFTVPVDVDGDRFITGYDVQPGNPQLIHHVVAFVVDPARVTANGRTNQEVMAGLHADDPDPSRDGWSCFGMAGSGIEFDGMPVSWAPGQGIVHYPAGLGVALGRDHVLVINVHYNMASSAPVVDQTTLHLKLDETVERRAMFVSYDNLLASVYRPVPDTLAPGKESVTYSWERSARDEGFPPDVSADVVAFLPHMHTRGRKLTLEVASDGSSYACQGKIDAWDFNWQRIYEYEAPFTFEQRSKFRVTCQYDTSADTAPVQPGWGTRNEMCMAVLMLALPPGVSP